MNINSSEVAATVGRKIREIYTQGLLQTNLTASVKVKSYSMRYSYRVVEVYFKISLMNSRRCNSLFTGIC